jgi:hypothetical protein
MSYTKRRCKQAGTRGTTNMRVLVNDNGEVVDLIGDDIPATLREAWARGGRIVAIDQKDDPPELPDGSIALWTLEKPDA